jgi:hypothetical protein
MLAGGLEQLGPGVCVFLAEHDGARWPHQEAKSLAPILQRFCPQILAVEKQQIAYITARSEPCRVRSACSSAKFDRSMSSSTTASAELISRFLSAETRAVQSAARH